MVGVSLQCAVLLCTGIRLRLHHFHSLLRLTEEYNVDDDVRTIHGLSSPQENNKCAVQLTIECFSSPCIICSPKIRGYKVSCQPSTYVNLSRAYTGEHFCLFFPPVPFVCGQLRCQYQAFRRASRCRVGVLFRCISLEFGSVRCELLSCISSGSLAF